MHLNCVRLCIECWYTFNEQRSFEGISPLDLRWIHQFEWNNLRTAYIRPMLLRLKKLLFHEFHLRSTSTSTKPSQRWFQFFVIVVDDAVAVVLFYVLYKRSNFILWKSIYKCTLHSIRTQTYTKKCLFSHCVHRKIMVEKCKKFHGKHNKTTFQKSYPVSNGCRSNQSTLDKRNATNTEKTKKKKKKKGRIRISCELCVNT